MTPEKLQDVLRDAVGRDVRLIPADLPPGCPAAWSGHTRSDRISYPANHQMSAYAVAHAAAHLALLHCGRIRDGGRFACTDARGDDSRDLLYRIHALTGGNDRELPAPLFTPEQEQAADEAATNLLARCGYPANAPRRDPGTPSAFRCLG